MIHKVMWLAIAGVIVGASLSFFSGGLESAKGFTAGGLLMIGSFVYGCWIVSKMGTKAARWNERNGHNEVAGFGSRDMDAAASFRTACCGDGWLCSDGKCRGDGDHEYGRNDPDGGINGEQMYSGCIR